MDPSPPRFISRFLVFSLSLYGIVFLGGLKNMRTEMTNNKQSAFEINGNAMFLVIGVVMLLLSEAMALILFWTNVSSKYYSRMKFAGILSSYLAPFSLMLVTGDSDKPDLVYMLLIYAVIGAAIAFMCSGDDAYDMSVDRSSLLSILAHVGLVLEPLALMLVLFVPFSLDWMVYPIVYTSMGMQTISFLIVFYTFVYSFEIQQGKNESYMKAQEDHKNIKDLEAIKTIIPE